MARAQRHHPLQARRRPPRGHPLRGRRAARGRQRPRARRRRLDRGREHRRARLRVDARALLPGAAGRRGARGALRPEGARARLRRREPSGLLRPERARGRRPARDLPLRGRHLRHPRRAPRRRRPPRQHHARGDVPRLPGLTGGRGDPCRAHGAPRRSRRGLQPPAHRPLPRRRAPGAPLGERPCHARGPGLPRERALPGTRARRGPHAAHRARDRRVHPERGARGHAGRGQDHLRPPARR